LFLLARSFYGGENASGSDTESDFGYRGIRVLLSHGIEEVGINEFGVRDGESIAPD